MEVAACAGAAAEFEDRAAVRQAIAELGKLGDQDARQEQLVGGLAEGVDRLDHLWAVVDEGDAFAAGERIGDAVGETRLDGVVGDEAGGVLEVVVVEEELIHEGRHGEALRVGAVLEQLTRKRGLRPGADVAFVEAGLFGEIFDGEAAGSFGDGLEEAEAQAVVGHAEAGSARGPLEDLHRLGVLGHVGLLDHRLTVLRYAHYESCSPDCALLRDITTLGVIRYDRRRWR